MKMRNQTAKWLLAGAVAGGAAMSYADDPITDAVSGDSGIPVTLTGTVIQQDQPVCSIQADSALEFNFSNDSSDADWTGIEGDWSLAGTTTGNATILCDAGTPDTKVTFSASNSFKESLGAACGDDGMAQCNSWPAAVAPAGTPTQSNFEEHWVTGNFNGTSNCSNADCSNFTSGVVGSMAELTVANISDDAIVDLLLSGTLRSDSTRPPYGDVQASPRAPTPQLFVIFEEVGSP